MKILYTFRLKKLDSRDIKKLEDFREKTNSVLGYDKGFVSIYGENIDRITEIINERPCHHSQIKTEKDHLGVMVWLSRSERTSPLNVKC